jgi:hypothetical protein
VLSSAVDDAVGDGSTWVGGDVVVTASCVGAAVASCVGDAGVVRSVVGDREAVVSCGVDGGVVVVGSAAGTAVVVGDGESLMSSPALVEAVAGALGELATGGASMRIATISAL